MNLTDQVNFVQLADQALVEKARAGGMKAFTTLTFPEYEWNWHHKLFCKYLNKFLKREIRRLMVFAPPRHGKTELTSRRLPAMIHGLYPNDEIMMAAYNADLASEFTDDIQKILDEPRYQQIFPFSRIPMPGGTGERNKRGHKLLPVRDPDTKLWFMPTGSLRTGGMGGSFTGRGADWLIIDDPVKGREDADSKAFRDKAWKTYTSSLRNRMEGEGSILITLTRWHEDDIVGRLLELQKSNPDADKWTILKLPAEREDLLNPEDPRELGEYLWHKKFSDSEYRQYKALGEREWSALFQQNPTSAEGGLIKRNWLQYYKVLPAKFDQHIQSWDLTFKGSDKSDYVVGQVWGRARADKYLIDQFRARIDFPETIRAFRAFSAKHPKAYTKLVESKANGQALIDTLKRDVPGIVPYDPKASKEERLSAVSADFEAGNVYLPDPSIAPWIHDYVSELVTFPNGVHDDQVDASTQALLRLRNSASDLLTKLSKM